jgi:hypothetical protein
MKSCHEADIVAILLRALSTVVVFDVIVFSTARGAKPAIRRPGKMVLL